MRINQNISAMAALRNLGTNNDKMTKSLDKLSSGFRINRAADDAAGLVISEGLRSQVGGLKVAMRNAQDGISVVQTAEGALTEVHSILQRMRDLTVQASNTGTNGTEARTAMQDEVDQLSAEITRITGNTKFNGVNLFDGNFGKTATSRSAFDADGSVQLTDDETFTLTVGSEAAVTVTVDDNTRTGAAFASYLEGAIRDALLSSGDADNHAFADKISVSAEAVGAGYAFTIENATGQAVALAEGTGTPLGDIGFDITTSIAAGSGSGGEFQVGSNANETISVSIAAMNSTSLGVNALDLVNGNHGTILDDIDDAILAVSTVRGELGAIQNRFEHTIANLGVAMENISASESRIRDVDMASEMAAFTRNQIMTQAGTAMLAQANATSQNVLSLLR